MRKYLIQFTRGRKLLKRINAHKENGGKCEEN